MESGAVTVAYCHDLEVAHSWHRSMVDLFGYDLAHNRRIMRGGFIAMRCGTNQLIESRNKVVAMFLERDAEWLFWIDTDMGFKPDTVDRLVEAADPVERPIVGGLCFAQREVESDGFGGFRCKATPTVFRWAKDPKTGAEGFAALHNYPKDDLVKVAGTGSACILIHRTVLEKINADHPGAWYNRIHIPSSDLLLSEDLSFCVRAAALDIPVYVHTGIRTTHLKHVWLAEPDHDLQHGRTDEAPDRVRG